VALLVRPGVGREGSVEEFILQAWSDRRGQSFFARGRGDDGQELKLRDGRAGDIDALGVGADVGRGEMESGVVEDVVQQRNIDGGEALELVGFCGGGAEGEAEPETFAARPSEEGSASEPFGVDCVREIEVADVADVLDLADKKRDDVAAEVEEIDGAAANEGGQREVAGEDFSGEAAHDDFFAGGRHASGGLSHTVRLRNEKGAKWVANLSPMW
jgi:hypothetical protein